MSYCISQNLGFHRKRNKGEEEGYRLYPVNALIQIHPVSAIIECLWRSRVGSSGYPGHIFSGEGELVCFIATHSFLICMLCLIQAGFEAHTELLSWIA